MSSSVTLSAATRTNLLSLQGTADLLATTQNRLSTGKKVNSALDSPVNYFTSQALGSRSSDLSSLLDGISNGIQTIQAANQGITNLQKLTDQLKSTANQALSATNAFTAKAAVTSKALNGAVASNLLSTGATQAQGTAVGNAAAIRGVTTGTVDLSTTGNITTALAGSQSFQIDGVNINITDTGSYTQTTLANAINTQLTQGGSTAQVAASGNFLKVTGETDGSPVTITGGAALFGASPTATTTNQFSPTLSSKATSLGFADGDSFTVNGSTVSVSKTDTISTLAQKVASATNGDVTAAFNTSTRQFTFTAKDANTSVNLGNGSTATALVSNLGYTTTNFASGLGANGSTADLSGKVLQVTVGTGTNAKTTALTFGAGAGQISTLDQLNTALGTADAQATIDSTGHLTITSTNDAGSQNLLLGGSAVGGSSAFLSSSSVATIGGDGQNARNKLVNDYNGLLTQINQMSKDSGYNGVNLLNGDQMKVAFNADNTSSIAVKGVATTADSLGLNTVSSSDFIDNDSINKVFSQISSATNTLKSQAATFSSNLSVVQNRQDFTKGIINVLDTGSANLVNADMNEEAANSQALSTRNSLGISALSLANTAQQGVLQLLR